MGHDLFDEISHYLGLKKKTYFIPFLNIVVNGIIDHVIGNFVSAVYSLISGVVYVCKNLQSLISD